MAWSKNRLFGVVLSVLQGIAIVISQNTSTTPSNAPGEKEDDKPFPAWLIGVIVLSSLLVIGIVITIIQRLIRKRNERMEQYRLQAD